MTSFVEMQQSRRTGQLVDKRACLKVGAKIFCKFRGVATLPGRSVIITSSLATLCHGESGKRHL